MSAGGGTKAIVAALVANAGIAVAKFVGFVITGSSSMLAESVHSVADTSNQGLLLLGQKTSQRKATRQHPFGFGRDRYFYSFVVALMLFSLGSVFALYEGIHKLQHPEALTRPIVAVVILVVAIGLETYSFRTAIVESQKIKGDATWWQFIRQSRTPELPVVLLEDAGALFGLVLALFGVGLSMITGDPVWDARRHDLHRRAARRHRDHPDHRDEEPADRRGRHPTELGRDRRRAGRGQGAARDPHPDPVHRPGRAAGRGEDRAEPRPAARRRWREAIDDAEQRVREQGPGRPPDLPRARPGPLALHVLTAVPCVRRECGAGAGRAGSRVSRT